MLEVCDKCNYTSDIHRNFLRHICKQKTDFQCKHCLRYYKTLIILNEHITNKCKKKDKVVEELEEKNKEIAKLKAELEKQKQTNITQNININQNITQNINIVLPHNKTKVNLTDAEYYEIVGRYLMSIPVMIEKIHFNEKNPQNHNIYISNIKNKYAMLYDGSDWTLQNRDTAIHNLIDDNETRIEEWIAQEEISQKYPTAIARFEKYLSLKEKDENLTRLKEEILLMLYNKRNIIQKIN